MKMVMVMATKEKEKTTVAVSPDQDNDKKEKIQAAGKDDKSTRKRISYKAENVELKKQLAGDKSENQLKGDDLALISKGLFSVVQGLTGLPFMQVDEELRNAFAESGAACINKYFPNVGDHAPLFQFGTVCMLVVSQAVAKQAEQRRKATQIVTKETGSDNNNNKNNDK